MKSLRRHTAAGGAFAILAMAACFSADLPTATSPVQQIAPPRPTADIALAPTRAERACAVLTVNLKNKRQDGSSINPAGGSNCTGGLRIVLADSVQYDYTHNLVRVPIMLENGGTRTLRTPARLYGWEDSLTVTANGNGHHDDLHFHSSDGSIATSSAQFGGANFWSFDTLLAPTGQLQSLVAGARSKIRWIEIEVPHNPKQFTANLEAEASDIPATPIIVIADSMLNGSPVTDTAAYVGDQIAYSYTPRPGYANVQVRIDGRAAPAVGSIRADTAHHVLEVTVDRVITVPAGLDGLYATAQAVLTSADIPAAFQQWLDKSYAYLEGAGDSDQAQRNIADIEYLAFDDVGHVADMARVDDALAAKTFRIGPDQMGPDGVVLGKVQRQHDGRTPQRLVPGVIARSVVQAPGDTIESTTYIYVNGMATENNVATNTTRVLKRMVLSVPGFNASRVQVKLHYNRNQLATYPTPAWRYNRCVMLVSSNINKAHQKSWPEQLSRCMANDTTYRRWQDLDLLEAVREVAGIMSGSESREDDAITLTGLIQAERAAGRHAIVIAHSQGNLLTNQAIYWIKENPTPGLDSTCIALVSMASPVNRNWDIPDNHIAKIIVDGDMVAGLNFWPKISTELSRAVQREAVRRAFFGGDSYYLLMQGFSTLHSVDASYLKYETKDSVAAGIRNTYAACAVSRMAAEPVNVDVSKTFGVKVHFYNAFGDTLVRLIADDQLTSLDSAIAAPFGPGTFQARARGNTTIEATHGGRSVQVPVSVQLTASIVGTWSGTFHNLDKGTSGPMNVIVSGAAGTPSTLNANWIEPGQAYVGSMAGTNIVHGTSSAGGSMFYHKQPGFVTFSRVFNIQLDGTNPDHAIGTSYDTSFGNYYTIDLSRVLH